MNQRERILVTVRTYPNISTKYVETVCTGGITESGEWRRLYPVPLRYLDAVQKYSTYDVIEVTVGPGKDGRPETRFPNCQTIKTIRRVENWDMRCAWVNPTISPSLTDLQQKQRTIGPVVVREVKEFFAKPTAEDWSPKQQELLKQDGLFGARKPLQKVPFDFRFVWVDGDGIEHDSMILAWEFGETWRQYRVKYPDPIDRMRDKWMNEICIPKNEVAFYMGNSREHPQHFMICGIFYPPREVSGVDHLF